MIPRLCSAEMHIQHPPLGTAIGFAWWISHMLRLRVLAHVCYNNRCLIGRLCTECVTRFFLQMVFLKEFQWSNFKRWCPHTDCRSLKLHHINSCVWDSHGLYCLSIECVPNVSTTDTQMVLPSEKSLLKVSLLLFKPPHGPQGLCTLYNLGLWHRGNVGVC